MRSLPDFALENQDGLVVTREDIDGPTIVFFYPAASTPGCTQEACDFRDSHEAFASAGYRIVGVSPDIPQDNASFRQAHALPFDLLSDVDHLLADALGTWGTKVNYGREYQGLIRSTFVVAASGEVEREYRNVKATGHVARLLHELL